MFDELLDVERVPHRAMRAGETLLKRQLFALENRTVLEQQRMYREAYRNLRAAALDIADQQGVTKLDHSAPATQFRDQYLAYAEQRLAVLNDQIMRSTIRAAQIALLGGYYGNLWLLDMVTDESTPIRKPILSAPGTLNEDLYDDLIQSLMGRKWREQYQTELGAMTLEVRRAIGNGMLDGQGIDEVMRRVARSMGVMTDRRRGSPGSADRAAYRANFNRVQAITRTTINEVSNAGAVNAYRANEDVLEGYQWLTAKDERVCPTCAMLDGRFYELSDHVRPPRHPNCRCTVIPVLRGKMLTDGDGLPRTPIKLWARQNGMEGELADFLKPTGISMRAPNARAARAAISAPKLSPAGTPVSNALTIPSKGKIRAEVQETLNAIDSVHGDGALPEIPVKGVSSDNYHGAFYSSSAGPGDIRISTSGTHKMMTTAHETGHFIDFSGIGEANRFTSRFAPYQQFETVMDDWLNAVQNSPEWQLLEDMRLNPKNHTTVGANGYTYGPNYEYIQYVLTPEELWARSYAQYIAEESGNAAMLAELDEMRGSSFYKTQWSTESFAPIRAAINSMFQGLGWLK